jgi:hypothetical protein
MLRGHNRRDGSLLNRKARRPSIHVEIEADNRPAPRNVPHFNVELAQLSREQTHATEPFYRGPDYSLPGRVMRSMIPRGGVDPKTVRRDQPPHIPRVDRQEHSSRHFTPLGFVK